MKAYDTPHTTTGMEPSKVRETEVLKTWKRMNEKRRPRRATVPKFTIGQHVRISKEMRFTKGGEQNYTTEVFRILKVIRSTPRDLSKQQIDG